MISVIGDCLISSARSKVISEGGSNWDVEADAGGDVINKFQR